MKETIISTKIARALEFCAEAHIGQVRKMSVTPYSAHPSSVGYILQSFGYSEDVIIAGILHDVLEDTKYTKGDLEEQFGSRVAELVSGVTEGQQFSTWQEKKEDYMARVSASDDEVKALSAADLLDNCMTMVRHIENGRNIWESFTVTKEAQISYLKKRLEIFKNHISDEFYNKIIDTILHIEKSGL